MRIVSPTPPTALSIDVIDIGAISYIEYNFLHPIPFDSLASSISFPRLDPRTYARIGLRTGEYENFLSNRINNTT